MAQVYKQVFTKYNLKLVTSLPMDDVLFITNLTAANLLPGDMQATIGSLATPAQKASHFLTHSIKPAIDNEFTNTFDTLLTVMQNCGFLHVQQLAAQIKAEITPGNGTYVHT